MMSDFTLEGEDYVDLMHNDEDLKKFNRMKELVPILKAHDWREVLSEMEEYANLDAELKGKRKVKFALFDSSKTQNN
jgi:hypothetical protein